MSISTEVTLHNLYMEKSPYYKNLVEAYGRQLSRFQASRIAASHATTLEGLGLDPKHDRFSTLDLVLELGY